MQVPPPLPPRNGSRNQPQTSSIENLGITTESSIPRPITQLRPISTPPPLPSTVKPELPPRPRSAQIQMNPHPMSSAPMPGISPDKSSPPVNETKGDGVALDIPMLNPSSPSIEWLLLTTALVVIAYTSAHLQLSFLYTILLGTFGCYYLSVRSKPLTKTSSTPSSKDTNWL